MGDLFNNICKGPVVVIDDCIGKPGDLINEFITEIDSASLPLLKFTDLEKAKDRINNLLFSNFTILDWNFLSSQPTIEHGVSMGPEAESEMEKEILEFISDIQSVNIGPIFIVSNLDGDAINDKLEQAQSQYNFNKKALIIANKSIIKEKGGLIIAIEEWINQSSHLYFSKWFINELLKTNSNIYLELFAIYPEWPLVYYNSFKDDKIDPVLALKDTLHKLLLTEFDISNFDDNQLEQYNDPNDHRQQFELYQRLYYTKTNIGRDTKPGDIFKIDGKYYLNIRPECDTTKRVRNPELYLLEGVQKTPNDLDRHPEVFYKERIYEIILFNIDDNNIIVFNKRKLRIRKINDIKDSKICRINEPFITHIQHSFSSYIGRYGLPRYPKDFLKDIFNRQNKK